MKYLVKEILISALLLFDFSVMQVSAQQKAKFSIESIEWDFRDNSAQKGNYGEVDADGNLFAIIKVSSKNPGDNLKDYTFSFGMMYDSVSFHDNEMWLYVQKNAQYVTIRRDGYEPLVDQELGLTLEKGKTYRMVLNSQERIIRTQFVNFDISPKDAKDVAIIINKDGDSDKKVWVAKGGIVEKNIPLGVYEYRVTSDNYKDSSPTRIVLNDESKMHYEKIVLSPNFSTVTLQVNSDAEIYLNSRKKGFRTWTGILNAGTYSVECRQDKHTSRFQNITVVAGHDSTYQILPPLPKVGMLKVISTPRAADVIIDGRKHGVSPLVVNDLLIGKHELTLLKENYNPLSRFFDIKENVSTDLEIALAKRRERIVKPYFSLEGAMGTAMGVGANFGLYFKKFNVEPFFDYGLSKETVYINSNEKPQSEDVGFNRFGIRFGYELELGSHFRIIPQMGLASMMVKGDEIKSNATSLLLGAKCKYLLNSHWGLTLTPEGMFSIKKGDVFTQLSEVSSKAKGWATGINVRLGVEFCF